MLLTPVGLALLAVWVIATHIPGVHVPNAVSIAVGVIALVCALVDLVVHGYKRGV